MTAKEILEKYCQDNGFVEFCHCGNLDPDDCIPFKSMEEIDNLPEVSDE